MSRNPHYLSKVLNGVSVAKEELEEAERKRDQFLEPILTILGATGGGIDSVYQHDEILFVNRTGSCRGCRWDDDYEFPMSIFTADDPIAAAHKYVIEKKAAEAEAEKQRKLAEIQRLQKELGV
jgi:hypothetical protein